VTTFAELRRRMQEARKKAEAEATNAKDEQPDVAAADVSIPAGFRETK
jgi:hypothetical protein